MKIQEHPNSVDALRIFRKGKLNYSLKYLSNGFNIPKLKITHPQRNKPTSRWSPFSIRTGSWCGGHGHKENTNRCGNVTAPSATNRAPLRSPCQKRIPKANKQTKNLKSTNKENKQPLISSRGEDARKFHPRAGWVKSGWWEGGGSSPR